MKTLAALTAAAGTFMASTVVMAQDTSGYPDMRGQWKATSESVVLGSGKFHRQTNNPGEPRLVTKEFTMNIKGQEGRRFWGEVTSQDDTGPILGVIASDKKTLYLAGGSGGHMTGALIAPGKFEICYVRPGTDVVIASCNVQMEQ